MRVSSCCFGIGLGGWGVTLSISLFCIPSFPGATPMQEPFPLVLGSPAHLFSFAGARQPMQPAIGQQSYLPRLV